MTNDELMPFLAWIGVVVWLSAFCLAIARRFRPAAALTGLLALPFLVPSLVVLLRWAIDPVAYTTRYGTAALTELRLTAVIAGLAVLVLTASALAYRGRVRWGVFAWLIDGAGVAFLLYLVYFFRIFQ
jgi:hypothetical protein